MAAPLSKAGKSKAGKSEEIKAKNNNCEDNNPADSNLESTTPCWCVSESFPENYQEQLAERDIDTRCICPGCLAQLSRR
ncbi:hypothetical protein GCM10007876_20530 [Litoribrevibacter albus]|uniref:Uncharacterized protein n=2 Tax=Litoribrevibacter albus TaxID=1473156 RepID=A0AA37W7T2_9GAMM|nr:hypothetical protein GCM10007876_20530 [Litoribrevibacter albus]